VELNLAGNDSEIDGFSVPLFEREKKIFLLPKFINSLKENIK